MQTSFLPLLRAVLFAVPPVAPFVGASDIGHGFNWPETGNWAWESNPGPIKLKSGIVQGLNPGPTKFRDHMDHKKQVDLIAGSQEIYSNTDRHVERDRDIHVERARWMMDGGQTNERWPDK